MKKPINLIAYGLMVLLVVLIQSVVTLAQNEANGSCQKRIRS